MRNEPEAYYRGAHEVQCNLEHLGGGQSQCVEVRVDGWYLFLIFLQIGMILLILFVSLLMCTVKVGAHRACRTAPECCLFSSLQGLLRFNKWLGQMRRYLYINLSQVDTWWEFVISSRHSKPPHSSEGEERRERTRTRAKVNEASCVPKNRELWSNDRNKHWQEQAALFCYSAHLSSSNISKKYRKNSGKRGPWKRRSQNFDRSYNRRTLYFHCDLTSTWRKNRKRFVPLPYEKEREKEDYRVHLPQLTEPAFHVSTVSKWPSHANPCRYRWKLLDYNKWV